MLGHIAVNPSADTWVEAVVQRAQHIMARCPLVRKNNQTDRGMEEVEELKITAGPEVGPSPQAPVRMPVANTALLSLLPGKQTQQG